MTIPLGGVTTGGEPGGVGGVAPDGSGVVSGVGADGSGTGPPASVRVSPRTINSLRFVVTLMCLVPEIPSCTVIVAVPSLSISAFTVWRRRMRFGSEVLPCR